MTRKGKISAESQQTPTGRRLTGFVLQFPARRHRAEQDGAAPRRRGHHLRDEVHHHAGLYDGPPLLPAGQTKLHCGD